MSLIFAGRTRWKTSSSTITTGASPQAPKTPPDIEAEEPVGGRSANFDFQFVFNRLKHFLAAADVAGRSETNANEGACRAGPC